VTRREQIAADLIRRRRVSLADYPYKRGHRPDPYDKLDHLRTIEDEALRKSAWDLYWFLEAQQVEHDYRLPESVADESERRYP
jgi:hypothetical protein